MIDIKDLRVQVGDKTLLEGVSCSAAAGQVTGLIGPNGAGKSTLLAAISGDLSPSGGSIRIAELNPAEASAQDMSRVRAVMLQDVSVSFAFLVRDVVSMGRRPWAGTAREELDDAIVDGALAATDVSHLAARDIATLSGGERARVALSRVLAQNTPVLLLDEPTAALDIRHQEQVLGLVRSLAHEAGVAVLVVLHDLNAAAAYCDKIICLSAGGVAAQGTVPEVYTAETLSAVYGWPITVDNVDGRLSVHPAQGQAADPESQFISLLKES